MTARIEIGRLAAKDLGKTVRVGGFYGELTEVSHYFGLEPDPLTHLEVFNSEAEVSSTLPSSTLIEVTGTPSTQENAK